MPETKIDAPFHQVLPLHIKRLTRAYDFITQRAVGRFLADLVAGVDDEPEKIPPVTIPEGHSRIERALTELSNRGLDLERPIKELNRQARRRRAVKRKSTKEQQKNARDTVDGDRG